MVEEKESSAHVYVDTHKDSETGSHDQASDDGFLLENDRRASAERQLLKKLDHRLLPTIVVIYILNYIDVCEPHLAQWFCLLIDVDIAISRNISKTWWTRTRFAFNRWVHWYYEECIYISLAAIQYSVVLAILFAAYCPAQVPSNMVTPLYLTHFYFIFMNDIFLDH